MNPIPLAMPIQSGDPLAHLSPDTIKEIGNNIEDSQREGQFDTNLVLTLASVA